MCCPTCLRRRRFCRFLRHRSGDAGRFRAGCDGYFHRHGARRTRWARGALTNTQSAFGAEYDSLSDMVSFGAAPALVIYEWALRDLGRLGWIAAFIYCAGAALRLARFNTTLEVMDKRYFQGLPSPAAAALVAGLVWVMIATGVSGSDVRWLACVLTVFAGVTMISNIRYYSFKDVNLKKSVPFFVIAGIALGFALVAYSPEIALFGFFVLYGLSGYVLAAVGILKRKSV